MLDYHLHLWPHAEATAPLRLEQVAAYCETAAAAGVTQLALTEHLHRFRDVRGVIDRHLAAAEGTPALHAAMGRYFDHHARSDLESYVALCEEAKAAGLPVVTGLEVDYFEGQMDAVGELLGQYPFDVLLGSVHWLGAWQFDDLSSADQLAEWDARRVDAVWDAYTAAMEELAATRSCDVLAHPDLVKLAGRRPASPVEWWDRIAEAAAASGMAAEVSSAGWRKPVAEQYPAAGLLVRFVGRGVPLTTASDAHQRSLVADRSGELRDLLASVGVGELAGYASRVRHAVPLAPP